MYSHIWENLNKNGRNHLTYETIYILIGHGCPACQKAWVRFRHWLSKLNVPVASLGSTRPSSRCFSSGLKKNCSTYYSILLSSDKIPQNLVASYSTRAFISTLGFIGMPANRIRWRRQAAPLKVISRSLFNCNSCSLFETFLKWLNWSGVPICALKLYKILHWNIPIEPNSPGKQC